MFNKSCGMQGSALLAPKHSPLPNNIHIVNHTQNTIGVVYNNIIMTVYLTATIYDNNMCLMSAAFLFAIYIYRYESDCTGSSYLRRHRTCIPVRNTTY